MWSGRSAGAALLAATLASAASAQTYSGFRIEADGCGPQPADVSTGVASAVARLGGAGTPEAGGSYSQCSSGVDSATGAMYATTTLSRAGGTFATLPVVATGSFEEILWIDGLQPGETAVIEASLGAGGGAEVAGATGSALASASLRVGSCRITRTFRSTGELSDTPNCSWADSFATGDGDGLYVTLTVPYELLGPSPLGNYVYVAATVRGEVSFLNVPGVGAANASGQLAIDASGPAEFRFAHPDTLTVPEPASALAGVAAWAALSAVACRGARRARASRSPSA
ncbi:MAG: hypothetical protein DCC71_07055 [Proteobacteria bacterium]|nr:MAG: hypothetical protein DCC71_07055 [Pseudomonadota bacterium]